jgi:lipoprotein-anchoring transpeptidase ErfK/SrfK
LALAATTAAEAGTSTSRTRVAPVAAIDVVGSGQLVWSSVAVRAKPGRDAAVLVTMSQFRADFHPRVVLAVDEVVDARTGRPSWYRISLPGRPNGRTGWIPATSVELRPVDRWIVIYRGSRRFDLYVDGELARTGPVAVGARGMETPTGLFYVQSAFTPKRYPILGAFAFETSGYSKLSDWPGGGVVGVHGTNTPELIGQAVSHGCVRLLNRDILALRRYVTAGTPVKIVGV